MAGNAMRCLVLPFLLALGLAMPAAAASGSDWVLMGRHGGCVSLRDAAQRREEFRGVSRPQELVEKLRRRGEKVETREIRLGDGAGFEVTASGLGLAVIFVPRKMCPSLR